MKTPYVLGRAADREMSAFTFEVSQNDG